MSAVEIDSSDGSGVKLVPRMLEWILMRMARRLAKPANVKKRDRSRLGGKSLDLPVKTGLRCDAFALKLISITAMAVDHIGALIYAIRPLLGRVGFGFQFSTGPVG